MSTQYRIREASPYDVAHIQDAFNLPHFIAEIIVSRGMVDLEEVERFLSPSLGRDWLDPYLIDGMEAVVDRLYSAIKNNETIVVFGDFDLDGISATTVMTRGIRALGGRATPFIPRRFDEGYGITQKAYERVKQLDPDLIITVDCGISCKVEVDAIVESGVSVVITDHHEAGDLVPVGVPLCDPKISPDCRSSILAGVGVALKVIQALGSKCGYPYLWRSYTDLATLGTVADLMPMVGENRALVADGLGKMNEEPRPCISAMRAVLGNNKEAFTSVNLSYSLIPRLNAAGRMGDAEVALELLMCDNYEEAYSLAMKLEDLNDQRRTIEAELSEAALAIVEREYSGERIIVVSGEGWHEGVKGIVSSRLVTKYGVPAILFSIDGDEARGSGRSVGNVNLYKAIESTSDLLIRFGGHEAAVGVTLPTANLEEFTKRLNEYMEQLSESEFIPVTYVDACIHLNELSIENVDRMAILAPFGHEMPEPKMLAKNVMIHSPRAVGVDKNHLACKLTDGKDSISAIMFNCRSIGELMSERSLFDAVFTASVDEWRGKRSVKLMLTGLVLASCSKDIERCDLSDADRPEVHVNAHSANTEAPTGGPVASDSRGVEQGDPACLRADHRDAGSDGASAPRCSRSVYEVMAKSEPEQLACELIHSMIGDGKLHNAQKEILERLNIGKSTLGIMATGRGKSLIFQLHAAMLALKEGKVSIFIYPLRALMADQAYHLVSKFEHFGLKCDVLNGECTQDERVEIYGRVKNGEVDIVLTTPEYLALHADDVSAGGNIGFVVIDEAHHIGQSKAGNRPSYSCLGDVVRRLGDPVVLAVTATADDEVAKDISNTLSLDGCVIDMSDRPNLHLDDQRGISNKDDYLAHVVAEGGKCVIYVNSREQTIAVAKQLRSRMRARATRIGFYNAGLSREERKKVEELFRAGELEVLVATSAFGEGIDIPDIRHVILYHMPFSDIEFNQMSGRAGRDGLDSCIHLLYGKKDVAINESILFDLSPDRNTMAKMYRALLDMQRKINGPFFMMDPEKLCSIMSGMGEKITSHGAECALSVFRELGLIDVREGYSGGTRCQEVNVILDAEKVELIDSIRYREGLDEQMSFREFREWALGCDHDGLLERITHPIAPDEKNLKGNE